MVVAQVYVELRIQVSSIICEYAGRLHDCHLMVQLIPHSSDAALQRWLHRHRRMFEYQHHSCMMWIPNWRVMDCVESTYGTPRSSWPYCTLAKSLTQKMSSFSIWAFSKTGAFRTESLDTSAQYLHMRGIHHHHSMMDARTSGSMGATWSAEKSFIWGCAIIPNALSQSLVTQAPNSRWSTLEGAQIWCCGWTLKGLRALNHYH